MPDADAEFVERAIERIFRGMLALSIAGVLAAAFVRGWRGGLGFLVGAAASYLNFYWVHRMVESLVPGARRPGKWTMLFIALRYLILGAGGYAIVRLSGLSVTAVLIGLFVAVAAVIVEIIYELIYAGT